MDIEYLREFLNLAETLSYSETAYRLDVSTSSLSRHIQQLESELGVPLFERTTRAIHLSDFGKIYHPYAVNIVQVYDNGIHAAEGYRLQQNRSFAYGTVSMLEEYGITKYLILFKRKYPDYNANMIIGTIGDLEARFRSGAINVYTAVPNPDIPELNFIKFGECRVRAVVREDFIPRDQKRISLRDLAGMPLILPNRGTIFYNRIVSLCERAGIHPQILYTGEYAESILLIREKMGVGLFPFESARNVAEEDFRIVDTCPEITCEYGLGYRERLTPAERLFVDFQKQYAVE